MNKELIKCKCHKYGHSFSETNEYIKRAKRKKIPLVVHHIKELENHPEFTLDIDNLETVCVDCHNKEHGRVFEQKESKWNDEKW